MQTLYDSESFVVMHMHPDAPEGDTDTTQAPQLARHGFEIVDNARAKRCTWTAPGQKCSSKKSWHGS